MNLWTYCLGMIESTQRQEHVHAIKNEILYV